MPRLDRLAGAIHSFRKNRTTVILPFDEAGLGRPVVLLHARPVDHTMWRAHLCLLAESGVRAIALDLPGHGDAASVRRDEATPWTDVLDTLDHVGVDRFVLAGNSPGALVALQIAVTEPQRVHAPIPDSDDPVCRMVAERRDITRSRVLDRVRQAIAEGALPPETDAEAIAGLVYGFLMGISTQARDGVPAETMQRSADALLALWGKQAETLVAENRAKE